MLNENCARKPRLCDCQGKKLPRHLLPNSFSTVLWLWARGSGVFISSSPVHWRGVKYSKHWAFSSPALCKSGKKAWPPQEVQTMVHICFEGGGVRRARNFKYEDAEIIDTQMQRYLHHTSFFSLSTISNRLAYLH